MPVTEVAVSRFDQGYSCSQAVFSSLAELWGIDPAVSLRIAAGFGGGLARTAGTCGCVTGAMMAIGLAQTDVTAEHSRSEKEKTCLACKKLMAAFEEKHGSTQCLRLLDVDISTPDGLQQVRQNAFFHARCTGFVRDAVETVQAMLPQMGASGK